MKPAVVPKDAVECALSNNQTQSHPLRQLDPKSRDRAFTAMSLGIQKMCWPSAKLIRIAFNLRFQLSRRRIGYSSWDFRPSK